MKHGRNALHYAADAGKVPIVKFLLGKMAIIDVSRVHPLLLITESLSSFNGNAQRKRHLKITIWEMVTIL